MLRPEPARTMVTRDAPCSHVDHLRSAGNARGVQGEDVEEVPLLAAHVVGVDEPAGDDHLTDPVVAQGSARSARRYRGGAGGHLWDIDRAWVGGVEAGGGAEQQRCHVDDHIGAQVAVEVGVDDAERSGPSIQYVGATVSGHHLVSDPDERRTGRGRTASQPTSRSARRHRRSRRSQGCRSCTACRPGPAGRRRAMVRHRGDEQAPRRWSRNRRVSASVVWRGLCSTARVSTLARPKAEGAAASADISYGSYKRWPREPPTPRGAVHRPRRAQSCSTVNLGPSDRQTPLTWNS